VSFRSSCSPDTTTITTTMMSTSRYPITEIEGVECSIDSLLVMQQMMSADTDAMWSQSLVTSLGSPLREDYWNSLPLRFAMLHHPISSLYSSHHYGFSVDRSHLHPRHHRFHSSYLPLLSVSCLPFRTPHLVAVISIPLLGYWSWVNLRLLG
jgi:hypothetical protein